MKNPFKKSPKPTARRDRLRREQLESPASSYSYHARRADQELNTGRATQRELLAGRAKQGIRSFWVNCGLVILLIALAASAVNIISLSNEPKVVPLTSDTALLQDEQAYANAAQKILQESLANRSKITINSDQIAKKIHAKFPELASVNVTIPLLARRPIVYIEAGRPALILTAASGSFVISDSGKVLSASTTVEPALQDVLPTIIDQNGATFSAHTQALPSSTVKFIETVASQMKAKNFGITSMTLPRTAGELDVAIAGQPYFVKFNIQAQTPREQAGTFFATIGQLQKQSFTPAKYVDVRVEGRAYYQ